MKKGGHIAESGFTSEHLMRKPRPAIKFGFFKSSNLIITSVNPFKLKEATKGETQRVGGGGVWVGVDGKRTVQKATAHKKINSC